MSGGVGGLADGALSLAAAAPGAPLAPAAAFALLAAGAAWDARTGRIPDALTLGAAVVAALARAAEGGYPAAAAAVAAAAGVVAAAMALNEAWWRSCGQECLGMGDAKWLAAALLAFGAPAAAGAWLAGSVAGAAWLLCLRAAGRPADRLRFAPFLLLGLVAAPLAAPWAFA